MRKCVFAVCMQHLCCIRMCACVSVCHLSYCVCLCMHICFSFFILWLFAGATISCALHYLTILNDYTKASGSGRIVILHEIVFSNLHRNDYLSGRQHHSECACVSALSTGWRQSEWKYCVIFADNLFLYLFFFCFVLSSFIHSAMLKYSLLLSVHSVASAHAQSHTFFLFLFYSPNA